ncbi:MAG: hypothetical protein L6R38_004972 [Xanthoria sp. 2 TBL-2021]|nr:MAG: hypothetical protein L6R38_004972 [Xanthoria sp. 2 TBL-2021]
MAQVSCSSWMRRLWTLQEGRLARRVWFQFADKAVDVKSVYEAHERRSLLPTADLWMVRDIYGRINVAVWLQATWVDSFSKVAIALGQPYLSLQSRSVSVLTDEALCLFTLLDLDITKVTAVPPQERMNVFWRTFNKVPSSLVFSRAPKKLLEPGLHWAPSSFMQGESVDLWFGPRQLHSIKEDDPHAVPTDEGLLAALPGLLFRANIGERMEKIIFTWGQTFIVQDENGSWFGVSLEEAWNQGSAASGTPQGLAIILANSQGVYGYKEHSHVSSDIFTPRTHSRGVLVSRKRTKEGIMHVTGLNHVYVKPLSEGEQKLRSRIRASLQEAKIPCDTYIALQSEHPSIARERCRMLAQRLLSNQEFLHLQAAFARHVGESDQYEDLLELLMEMIAYHAFWSECSNVQRLPASQQWCID